MSSSYAAQPHQRTAARNAVIGRRQRLSALEVATLVIIAVLLLTGAVAVRPHASATNATQIVQVQPGETLWSIAQAHPLHGLSTAQAVESIARENGLSSATLATGQSLVVPTGTTRVPQMASR